MDLQTLRFFRTVAEEGSYSAAAEKLNYAQSNLSSRIIQLEKECGAPLFQRHKNGVTMTEKGSLLLDYAVRILNLSHEMEQAVRDGGTVCGTLTIGSLESMASSALPGILAEYYKNFANTEIIVRTGTTAALLKALERHEIDGAFVAGEIRDGGYASIPVQKEELVLISAAPQKDASLRSLLGKTQLVFPAGCSYRRILEDLTAREGAAPAGAIEFHSLGAIIASVSAGLGVSLFPKPAVALYSERENLVCHKLPEPHRTVTVSFVYRDHEYLTHAMKHFINQLGCDGALQKAHPHQTLNCKTPHHPTVPFK